MKTKEKIINTSIELFNRQGVVASTTNHIAQELNISPGNLYFHYSNKEEIVRAIFVQLCKETYQVWRPRKTLRLADPLTLIDRNFDLYWKYRFFHREMYFLRRKDPQLAKLWKKHLTKVQKLMLVTHRNWVCCGFFRQIDDKEEAVFIANVLLSTASTFLQFFESSERAPTRRHVEMGKRYVARLLLHWTLGDTFQKFREFIKQAP